MSEETDNAAARVEALAAEYGLTMRAAFVPFSASRNAKPSPLNPDGQPWQSLNWRVTLERNGRDVLETDYGQGVAHAPAYKAKGRVSGDRDGTGRYARALRDRAIAAEIETGFIHEFGDGFAFNREGLKRTTATVPQPSIAAVLHGLALDSSVLDHATFESWAGDFGYSTDSRAAEEIYRACLAHALALRAAVGDAGLEALREAAGEM